MRPEPWWKRMLRRRLYLADAPQWALAEIVDLALIEAFAPVEFTREIRERFSTGGGLMEQADVIGVDGEVFWIFWLESTQRPGLPEHLADRKGGRKRRCRRPPARLMPATWPWR